ncbi:MAG TPA: hypothetical protein VFX49_13155 [Chloroflexota bacterium]|nr:hypothetical protein [Chloroflexota bacterium]
MEQWRYIASTAVSFMLSFMLMTAWLPFAPKRPGELLLQVPLGWKQRVMVHRTKAIALMALCLLGSIPVDGQPLFLPGTQAIGVVGLFVVTMIPMRYVFSDRGVAINNGVPKSYKSYRRFDVRAGQRWLSDTATVVLQGRRTERGVLPSHALYVPKTEQAEVVRLLKKHVR